MAQEFEVVKDALKQPLSFLIPKQDLVLLFQCLDVSIPVKTDIEMPQQSVVDLEKLFNDLEEFEDESLAELKFTVPRTLSRLQDELNLEHTVKMELPFSEREKQLVEREDVNVVFGVDRDSFTTKDDSPGSAEMDTADSMSIDGSGIKDVENEATGEQVSSGDSEIESDQLIKREDKLEPVLPHVSHMTMEYQVPVVLNKAHKLSENTQLINPAKRQKLLIVESTKPLLDAFEVNPNLNDADNLIRELERLLSTIKEPNLPSIHELIPEGKSRIITAQIIKSTNQLISNTLLHSASIDGQEMDWANIVKQITTNMNVYYLVASSFGFGKEVVFEEVLEVLSDAVVTIIKSLFMIRKNISTLLHSWSVMDEICHLIKMPLAFLEAGIDSDFLTVKLPVHVVPLIDQWLGFESEAKSRIVPIMIGISRVLTQICITNPNESKTLKDQLVLQLLNLKENSANSNVKVDSSTELHICSLNVISCISIPDANRISKDQRELIQRELYKESYDNSSDFLTAYMDMNNTIHSIVSNIVKTALKGNKVPLEVFYQDVVRMVKTSSHGIAILFIDSLISTVTNLLQQDTVPLAVETTLLTICGDVSQMLFEIDTPHHRTLLNVTPDDMDLLLDVAYTLIGGFKNSYVPFRTTSIDYFRLSTMEIAIMPEKLSQSQSNVFRTDEQTPEISKSTLSLYLILAKLFLTEHEPMSIDTYVDCFQKYTRFALDSTLKRAFDSILQSFTSSRIKTRSRAINCISKCISFKPELLGNEKLQFSLAELLKDASPMVRDSCIELLNNYLRSNPQFCDDFCRPLVDSLSDSSVQVKKRILTMVPWLIEEVDSENHVGYMVNKVFKGTEDEDENIREQSNKTLEAFFSSKHPPLYFIGILTHMMQISPRSSQNLQLFLETRVFTSSKNKCQDVMLNVVSETTDSILIGLPKEKLGSYLRLLDVFVKCNGRLLSAQRLESLQPLLMNVDDKDEDILLLTLLVFKHSLPQLPVVNDNFLDTILNHILSNLSKFNVKELHEAIPLASIISKHKKNTTKLANVTISSLRMTYGFIRQLKENNVLEFNGKLVKLMHIIGCIGSYWDLESQKELFMKADIGFAGKGPVLSLITKYLIHFNDEEVDIRIRRVFTLNVLGICYNHPKLYTHPTIMKHMDDELKSSSEETIVSKKVILQNIYDFIILQEIASSKANAKIHSSTQSVDINAFNGAGREYENDAICSALAQRYASKTLELTYSKDYEFAIVSLKLAGVIFGNGYVNPRMCIATFIGLLASDNQVIVKLALEFLKSMFDKHESMFESNYTEGFKNAVLYRYNTSANLFENSSILESLYKIIMGKLTARRKFVQALCKIFRIKTSLDLTESEAIFERDLVIFLLLNIVNIPFASLEEILMLYEASLKTLTRQGLDLYDLIKELGKEDYLQKKVACYGCNAGLCIMEFGTFLSKKYGVNGDRVSSKDMEARRAPKIRQLIPFNFHYQDILSDFNDHTKVEEIIQKFTLELRHIDI